MDMLWLAQQATNPSADTGATEFLANLSVGMVAGIALVLTIFRLILLRPAFSTPIGSPPEVAPAARGFAEILESLVIALVLVFLIIRPFFVQAFFIPSESMEPTLLGHNAGENQAGERHDDTVHDHIFVNKLIYRMGEPQRGDIIVFKAPKNADMESPAHGLPQQENVLIKRLIGVPGDEIEVRSETKKIDGEERTVGVVYRNGQKLDEYGGKEGVLSPMGYTIKAPISWPQAPNAVYAVAPNKIKLGSDELFVMGDNRNDSNDSRYWGPLKRNRVIGKASLIFWPLNRFRILH